MSGFLRASASRGFRTVLTAVLLVGAVGGWCGKYLAENAEKELDAKLMAKPVKAELIDRIDKVDGLFEPGTTIDAKRGVRVTQGEGYVRFVAEIYDPDGVSMNERLEQMRKDIKTYEYMLDPEMSSYLAFQEEYYRKISEYNAYLVRGKLIMETLCRSVGGEKLDTDKSYTEAQLNEMYLKGTLTDIASDGDFLQVYDEENPFHRSFIYKHKLKAGDSCMFYTNVVIPDNWEWDSTDMVGWVEYEDGTFEEQPLLIEDLVLIDEGYTIKIKAEAVDANGNDDAAAAFYEYYGTLYDMGN